MKTFEELCSIIAINIFFSVSKINNLQSLITISLAGGNSVQFDEKYRRSEQCGSMANSELIRSGHLMGGPSWSMKILSYECKNGYIILRGTVHTLCYRQNSKSLVGPAWMDVNHGRIV